MTRMPVSVVMAVYNGARFLPEQLSSLLADLHPDDELIVIDDASPDHSGTIIRAAGDARIKLLHTDLNLGVRLSFERGLRRARHDIVFLCDQDDIWVAGKRDAYVATFCADAHILVVLSDAQVIDSSGRVTEQSFMSTRGGFSSGFWSNVYRNRFLGCTMAFRRQLLADVLPIPAWAPMHDMWIGLMGQILGEVAYLPAPYLQYRRHDANVSPGRRQPWHRVLVWRVQLLVALVLRMIALYRRR